MDIKSKVGKRIKEIREKVEMSQKDLAYSADLDRSYIASVESGQRNISVSYTHLRAHETVLDLVCRLLLEKKKQQNT